MNYTILPSKRFQKAANKYFKGGRKFISEAAREVIDLLALHDDRSLFILGTRWRDHALKGNKQGIRELHLSQDELLLYSIDEELKLIKLLDIVSHEELRKQ